MIDYSELKKLAMNCRVERCADEDEQARNERDFLLEVDPEEILALIAENEALKENKNRLEWDQNIELKIENEALRKDADRYQWLRAQPTCYMTTEGWQIRHHWRDQNDSGRPHGIMSICLNEESLDGAIDDAMSKEAK